MPAFSLRRKLTLDECDVAARPKLTAAVADKGFVVPWVLRFPDSDPPAVTRYMVVPVSAGTTLDAIQAFIDSKPKWRSATLRELVAWAKTGWNRRASVTTISETLEHPMYGTLCPFLFRRGALFGVGMKVTRFEAVESVLVAEDS